MKNIAVICGGDSSEREVSVNSTLNVIKYVDRLKYCPYIVFIQGTDWFVMPAENQDARTVMEHQGAPTVDKNTFSFGSGNGLTAFDAALIMIHGTPGENGLCTASVQPSFRRIVIVRCRRCRSPHVLLLSRRLPLTSIPARDSLTLPE